MCGIIGILGKHEAAPILVEALKRLEYRGYDSSGIATVKDDGSIDRRRAVGKLLELQDKLVFEPLKGKAGIGHTRWATHGEPRYISFLPYPTAKGDPDLAAKIRFLCPSKSIAIAKEPVSFDNVFLAATSGSCPSSINFEHKIAIVSESVSVSAL